MTLFCISRKQILTGPTMHISYDTDMNNANEGMSLIALLVRRYNLTAADIFPDTVTYSTTAPDIKFDVVSITAAPANKDTVTLSTTPVRVEPSAELDAAVTAIEQADNPATGAPDAAEVFAPSPVVRKMLPNANGHTFESLLAAGWTEAQMISGQMMEAPKVTAPLPPSSGAATAPPNTVPTPPPPPSDAASVFAATNATPAPPAANAAAPADTTGGVQLDSDGLPWDGRIHASTRTKTAKGAWTKLKKVDPALYESVVAELRNALAINKAAAHVPLNTAPPPPPATTVAAPSPPPPTATGPATFADVMAYVGTRNFDQTTIQNVCLAQGVPGISLLGIMPAKCADVLAAFKAIP